MVRLQILGSELAPPAASGEEPTGTPEGHRSGGRCEPVHVLPQPVPPAGYLGRDGLPRRLRHRDPDGRFLVHGRAVGTPPPVDGGGSHRDLVPVLVQDVIVRSDRVRAPPAVRRAAAADAPDLDTKAASSAGSGCNFGQKVGGVSRGKDGGPTEGTRVVGDDPRVDAGGVEGVAADGEQPELVVGLELGEADGAVAAGEVAVDGAEGEEREVVQQAGGGLEASGGVGAEDDDVFVGGAESSVVAAGEEAEEDVDGGGDDHCGRDDDDDDDDGRGGGGGRCAGVVRRRKLLGGEVRSGSTGGDGRRWGESGRHLGRGLMGNGKGRR
ncbi:hypothetical protein STAS_26648 [Striga asiatica]|uniref:Uncharacterized protein n=1 Tax=Striga asiatica TaxID=4170 RepID=A0A5A7QYC3_STRAF|nr:hypothetical protein STAS_26648 [Striga asiatica]